MAAGAPKSPNNVTSTFFNLEHMLPKDLSYEYRSDKLASCLGRHLTSLRPCTAHVTIKLMKVNLPAHEVCTTPSMNEKRNHFKRNQYEQENLIYCDCSRWISSASCEKCGFNPVSRVFFIRGSTSLIEFVFFSFYFDKNRKSLLAKVVCWHCDQ